MKTVACLHTAASNAPLFDAACPTGLSLRHAIRPDLLAAAEAAGGLTPDLAAQTATALEALALPGTEAVLLTCSTLGPAIAQAHAPVPLRRADAALAEAATRDGGRLVVLCAVETTLAPTGRLFEAAAAATGATVTMRLVPGAWAAFKAGDAAGYAALVAAAADAAFAEGAARVALAQASMAPAAALCRQGRPLTVPGAALAAFATAP